MIEHDLRLKGLDESGIPAEYPADADGIRSKRVAEAAYYTSQIIPDTSDRTIIETTPIAN